MKKLLLGLLITASFGLNASQRAPEHRWKDEILKPTVIAGVATLFKNNLSQKLKHDLIKMTAGVFVSVASTDGRWSRDARLSLNADRYAQFIAGGLERIHATRKHCSENPFTLAAILAKGKD